MVKDGVTYNLIHIGSSIWQTNESFTAPSSPGEYSFLVNISGTSGNGISGSIENVNYTYYVQDISVSVNTDKSLYNPNQNVTVSGKVILKPDGTNVTNTNVSIYLDDVLNGTVQTDSEGNYVYTFKAPSTPGIYNLKVNLTNENGIYGENETTFEVSTGNFVLHLEDATGNPLQNVSVYLYRAGEEEIAYQGVTDSGGNWTTETDIDYNYDLSLFGEFSDGGGKIRFNFSTPINLTIIWEESNITVLGSKNVPVRKILVSVYDNSTGNLSCLGYTNSEGKLICGLNSSKTYIIATEEKIPLIIKNWLRPGKYNKTASFNSEIELNISDLQSYSLKYWKYRRIYNLSGEIGWNVSLPVSFDGRAFFDNSTNKTDVRIFFNNSEEIPFKFGEVIECYDNETEILTMEEEQISNFSVNTSLTSKNFVRWKYFRDLDGTEKVLTLNPKTKEMEWQKPKKYQSYNYSGEMYKITLEDGSSLLVSPEHRVYVSPKYSLTSSSERTLTTFCLFNLGSLDQIGALLNARDKAKYGESFKCGDIILASGKNCSYSDSGITLINSEKRLDTNTKTSSSLSSEYLDIFDRLSLISPRIYFGDINEIPLSYNLNTISKGLPLLIIQENTIFASTTNGIFYNLCFLSHPSLTISPNSKALSSVNLLLDAISFNNLFFNSISTQRSKDLKINSSNLISLANLLTSSSYPVGTFSFKATSFINNNTENNYLNNFSLERVTEIYQKENPELEYYFLDKNKKPVKVKKIEKIHYSGKIYDVDVENDIILVRRKGTPIWSGNSNLNQTELIFNFNKTGEYYVYYGFPDAGEIDYNFEPADWRSSNFGNWTKRKLITLADIYGKNHTAEPIRLNITGDFLQNCKDLRLGGTGFPSDYSDWEYRQPISISNTAGNLTNYQVRIDLNSTNVGSNFNWSNNGSDIRFTNSTDDELHFWIENWNSTGQEAIIWVNVTYLENNTNTTIYMYYGNPSASSASDVNSTFIREIDGVQPVKGSWHFDEDSGTAAKDTSGNDNDGTIYGATWTDGKFGKALNFDGGDDYVDLPKLFDFSNTNLTLEAWAYSNSTGTDMTIFARGGNGLGSGIFVDDDGTALFAVRKSDTTVYIVDSNSNVYNSWHHIIGVLDYPNLKIYVDGTLKNTTSGDYIPSDPEEASEIGADLEGSILTAECCAGYNYFDGLIDEVRVYNRALTAEEISDLYNNYGYTTENYLGKVLVRKYADPEPTASFGSEENNEETQHEVQYEVLSTDNSTWCKILFPVTVTENNQTEIYAYYSNENAAELGYSYQPDWSNLPSNQSLADKGDGNLNASNSFDLLLNESGGNVVSIGSMAEVTGFERGNLIDGENRTDKEDFKSDFGINSNSFGNIIELNFSEANISHLVIRQGINGATKVKINISVDGTNWEQILEGEWKNGEGSKSYVTDGIFNLTYNGTSYDSKNKNEIFFEPRRARYIKLDFYVPDTVFSLDEIELYGGLPLSRSLDSEERNVVEANYTELGEAESLRIEPKNIDGSILETNVSLNKRGYWRYQRNISLENGTGEFVIDLRINSSKLLEEGKILSDGRDIRVLDGNGEKVKYLIENWNTSETHIIFIANLSGAENYTLLYGNPFAEETEKLNWSEIPNLLLNYGFENGTNNWTWGGQGSGSLVSYGYEGDGYEITHSGIGRGYLYQGVDVETAKYWFAGFINQSNNDVGERLCLGDKDSCTASATTNITNKWSLASGVGSLSSGTINFNIKTINATVVFDNLYLAKTVDFTLGSEENVKRRLEISRTEINSFGWAQFVIDNTSKLYSLNWSKDNLTVELESIRALQVIEVRPFTSEPIIDNVTTLNLSMDLKINVSKLSGDLVDRNISKVWVIIIKPDLSTERVNLTGDVEGGEWTGTYIPDLLGKYRTKFYWNTIGGDIAELRKGEFEVRKLVIDNWTFIGNKGYDKAVYEPSDEFNLTVCIREFNGSSYWDVTGGEWTIKSETQVAGEYQYSNLVYLSGCLWRANFTAPSATGTYKIYLNGTSSLEGIYGENETSYYVNQKPQYQDNIVEPDSSYFSDNFTYNISVKDLDWDDVNVSLFVSTDNKTSWTYRGSILVEDPGSFKVASISTTFNYTDVGTDNYYKFQLDDGYFKFNTSEFYGPAEIKDKIVLTLTKNRVEIYRNDSFEPHNVTFTANTTNIDGNLISDVVVKFYINSSYIGNCTTDSNGICNFTYNPEDTKKVGNYTILANAIKEPYDSDSKETWILIKGKLYPVIESPAENQILYRGKEYWFNSSITDDNSTTIHPNLTWRIINFSNSTVDTFGINNESVYHRVNSSLPVGIYYVNLSVSKEFYDNASVKIPVNITYRWLYPNITTPTENQILYRGKQYWFNSTTVSIDGNSVSPSNVTWRIINSTGAIIYTFGGENNESVYWRVPSDIEPGNYTVNVTVSEINYDTNSTAIPVKIEYRWLYPNITNPLNGSTLYRGASYNFTSITKDIEGIVRHNLTVSWDIINSTGGVVQHLGNEENLTDVWINTSIEPGSYKIKLSVDKENFDPGNDTIEIYILKRYLLPNITAPNSGQILYRGKQYWFNSTTVSIDGNSVSPSNVTWRIINSTGAIIYTFGGENNESVYWRVPSDTEPGNYTVNVTVSEPNYDTNSTAIPVKIEYRWLLPNITNPVEGDTLLRGASYEFNSTTKAKDETIYEVTPDNATWYLINSTGAIVQNLGNQENFEQSLLSNLTYGTYYVKLEVSKQYYDTNSTNISVTIKYRSAVNITNYPAEIYRGTNPDIYARVYDFDNQNNLASYSVDWYVNNLFKQSSSTGPSGQEAIFTWDTSGYNLGYHNISAEISSLGNYIPWVDQSNVSILLKGILYINITKPENNTIFNRGGILNLSSKIWDDQSTEGTTNSYNVSWKLDSSEILNQQNGTWNIPWNYGIGEHNLTAIAYGENYDNGTDLEIIRIFGYSKVENLTTDKDSYLSGEFIKVICSVRDENTSELINNYPVKFYFNGTYKGTNLTSNGIASFEINTTGVNTGIYNVSCEIEDNETLFYNISENYWLDKEVEVQRILVVNNLTLNPGTIYRKDSYSPYQTNITAEIWDGAIGPMENATVHFYFPDGYSNCTTGSDGKCWVLWNPSDSITPNNYTILVNATKVGSTPSETRNISVVVRGVLNLTIIEPADNQILHKGTVENLVASVLDENGINVEANVNWTNSSNSIIAVGNETTWDIPVDYNLGIETITANGTKEFYDFSNKSVQVYIYGWSNITYLEPKNSGSYYEYGGGTTTIYCKVSDLNLSEANLSNYPVSFYYNGTYIGTENANSTGYAWINWNIPSLGLWNLSCNISDSQSLYYNVTVERDGYLLNVEDHLKPVIHGWNLSANQLETNYESLDIIANVSDNYWEKENITVEAVIIGEANVGLIYNPSSDLFEGSYTFSSGGVYQIYINATDKSGNWVNSSSKSVGVIGKTNFSLVPEPAEIKLRNITLSDNQSFVVNLTANNIGLGTGYNTVINITPSNKFVVNEYSQNCGNVSAGENCSKIFTITFLNNTNPGIYQIEEIVSWQNPDYSKTQVINYTTINVTSNPVLEFNTTNLIFEPPIKLGTGDSRFRNFTILSTGNDNLTGVTITCVSGVICENFTVSFSDNNFDLEKGTTKEMEINLTVPQSWQQYGDFNGTIKVENGVANYYSERTTKYLNLSVHLFREDVKLEQVPQSITVGNIDGVITKEINLTVINSGTDNITDVNLTLRFNTTGCEDVLTCKDMVIYPEYQTCNYIGSGENCTKTFYVNISATTTAATYYIDGKARYKNLDNSYNTKTNRTTLTVQYTYSFTKAPDKIESSVSHNQSEIVGYVNVTNTGNGYLSVNLSSSGGNLPADWISFSPKSYSLAPGTTQSSSVTVSVPAGQDPGIYITNITILTQEAGNKTTLLNISVPTDNSWGRDPSYIKDSIGIGSTKTFDITISNYGNVDTNFSVNYLGGTEILVNPPKWIYVNKTNSSILKIKCSGYEGGNYIIDVTITNQEDNSQKITEMNITVTEIPPEIYELPSWQQYRDVNYEEQIVRVNISDNHPLGDTCISGTQGCAWLNITGSETKIINMSVETTLSSVSPYNYTFKGNFTPTEVGTYYFVIYAEDDAGKINKSATYQFQSIGATELEITTNTSRQVEGVTNTTEKCFNQEFNLTNLGSGTTGYGGAYYTNLSVINLPDGWTASPQIFNYGKIAGSETKTNTTQICIPAGTYTGNYSLTLRVDWTNPNNYGDYTTKTVNVEVLPSPNLEISPSSITINNFQHGTTREVNWTLSNTGNLNATNIQIKREDNASIETTISPSSISNLGMGESNLIVANISVPLGFDPGQYQLKINHSCSNAEVLQTVWITVLENRSWNSSPEEISKLVGTNSAGKFGEVNLSNLGNVQLDFNLNITGNISSYLSYPSSVSVQKQNWSIIQINFSSPGTKGDYKGNLTISSSGASPENRTINLSMGVRNLEINLINYTNETNSSQVINLEVNLTYDNNPVNNSEFEVRIGGENCLNLNKNFENNLWKLNCTSPELKDGYYYDLSLKSIANISNSLIEGTKIYAKIIYYEDLSPPEIKSISAPNKEVQNETEKVNQTISVNITDATKVESATIEIRKGTQIIHSGPMENTTNKTWEINLTNLTKGDYDYNITATDGKYSNSTSDWFEVYMAGIYFIGSSTDPGGKDYTTEFKFYRPGKEFSSKYEIADCSFSASGSYSKEVHKRDYDLKISAFGHTIKLENVSIEKNITNPIKLDNLSKPLKNGEQQSSVGLEHGIVYFKRVLGVENNLNFSTGEVILNTNGYDPNTLSVYKCENWSFENRECNGDNWVEVTGVTRGTSTISFSVSGFSAYALVTVECGTGYKECGGVCYRNEDCPYCCNGVCSLTECTQETGGETGGGGGGGGGGYTPPEERRAVCGNGICEATESWENCPEDCEPQLPPTSVSSNIVDVKLHPGESKIYSLWITNNLKTYQTAFLSVSGTVWEFIQFERDRVNIEPMSTKTIKVKFATQTTTQPGIYTGNIMVSIANKSYTIPVTMTVIPEEYALMDVKVEVLTKQVMPDGTLRFYVSLYSLGIKKRFDVTLDYQIKEVDTEKLISHKEETMAIETSLSFVRNYDLTNVSLSPGKYFISVVANYENKTATSADLFEVIVPPWWYAYIPWAVGGIVILISLVLIIRFHKRKVLEKLRYLTPIDYKSLPVEGLKLGKIAETNKNAYLPKDELMTHVITAGATGSGKTVSAMVIVEECLKEKIPVIVFDPTGQWTGFVRPNRDERMLAKYKEFGLKEEDARSFPGMIYEVTDPNAEIDLRKYMNPGEITIFTLNKLKPGEYDVAVQNIVNKIFEQGWEESNKLRLLVVFDEVHRLLERYGGKGGYIVLEKAAREFRKWGIGLIMISQVLSDFKEALKGNVLTEIQLNTKALEDLKRSREKYGKEYAERITREEVGVGMFQNPKYNRGKPYWISFRPLLHSPHKIPDKELNLYKNFAAQLEVIERRIMEKKKAGEDVFDLELELKLAKGKLKEGKFRMAEIYVNSLKTKLGIE